MKTDEIEKLRDEILDICMKRIDNGANLVDVITANEKALATLISIIEPAHQDTVIVVIMDTLKGLVRKASVFNHGQDHPDQT